MNIIREGSWLTTGPSGAFEPSGLDQKKLNTALRNKFSSVSKASGEWRALNGFREWQKKVRDDLAALILQVPEIIWSEPQKPFMLAVAERHKEGSIIHSLKKPPPALITAPADYAILDDMCLREEPSPLRAMMAGELLIWVRKTSDAELIKGFMAHVRSVFHDRDVVNDLGLLLKMDIGTRMGAEHLRMPLCDKEFERIAKKEMDRRRVEKDLILRGKVLANARERLNLGMPRQKQLAMA